MSKEEESLQREAQLVEHERLMREKQERKERAKAERSAEQLIRKKGVSEELLPEPRQEVGRAREVKADLLERLFYEEAILLCTQ